MGGEKLIINLKKGRFRVGRRTKNFTLRTVRFREAVESPSAEVFKTRVDKASNNLNLIAALL